jgi:hypothetical protein
MKVYEVFWANRYNDGPPRSLGLFKTRKKAAGAIFRHKAVQKSDSYRSTSYPNDIYCIEIMEIG